MRKALSAILIAAFLFFINTLEKWNRLAEKETEARLVEKADENWEKLNAM